MRATVTVEDAEVVEPSVTLVAERRAHQNRIFHVSSPAADGRHAELWTLSNFLISQTLRR